MSKKILLTGASGFLGKMLLNKLQSLGHQVISPDSKLLSLAKPNATAKLPKDFDVIYHLATWTRAGSFCREKIGEQWLVNEKINLSILDLWARSKENCHLVSFGTSVGYGEGDTAKHEAKYLAQDPIIDYYGYSTTKRSLLYGQICLHKQFNKPYSHFIPSTIYGPAYHLDGRNLHFIYDIAKKIIRHKHFGENIILWGDGYQSRELVFIDDVLSVLTEVLDSPINDYVNIASGDLLTIRQAAKDICKILLVDPNVIRYDTNAFVGVKTKFLDVGKLNDMFPNRVATPFKDGILTTLKWMEPLVLAGKI